MSTALVGKITGAVNRVGFKLKKNSPEILIVAGIAGVVTSAVLACKATTKAGKIVKETKEAIDEIHKASERGVTNAGESYSEEDCKKDLTIVYVQTGLKFVKLYGPSVALGALSIMGILSSHNILKKRNLALSAAYAAVNRSFKEYRQRVENRFGEAIERELRYNIQKKKVEETVVDEETGKEKKVKKTIDVIDGDIEEISQYARFFDEGSPNWEKSAELNLMFLRAEQNFANDRLKARGYLFLNEVYERLGFPTTKAGQIVGWIYDPKNKKGDNYVDFGLYNINRSKTRDFVNGWERVILLDFNVDGNILDLLESHQRH